MNIIFLDVDGVLNSIKSLKTAYKKDSTRPYSDYYYPFDPRCLLNLKHLVEETDSYLVITSTWRKHELGREILLSELKKYNLDTRVIGYTDILNKAREVEIKAYLEKLDEDVNYIILDDSKGFPELGEYLIRTNYEKGLTKTKARRGIKKLLKNKDNVN